MFEGCSRHMEYLLNRMCNCYISEENLYLNLSVLLELLKKVDIVKSINNDKSVRIIFTNFKKKYIRHNAYNCKYNKKICFK
ncbi:hypothetical protein C923_02004 [Plasmodium falciparum UGT5.1]|uniref:Uncharacterized protein n=2 Tax=Plasmodium falciparum TaxID=5833 RepID=W7JEG8_PLAFA|nr:hypothetical protein PFBG_01940 [Plasmodium falciparum 7G8]EWC77327.1 hypothetical protein C923_02004 [Plasmodium falciparum UGT5.1]